MFFLGIRSIVPFEEVFKHFLSLFSGKDGILNIRKAPQIVSFILKGDLRCPHTVDIQINAVIAAGIARNRRLTHPRFQYPDIGSVNKSFIGWIRRAIGFLNYSQASAAFCFPGLEQCLPDNSLISAVAAAFPSMHSIPFSSVFDDCQLVKSFSYVVLYRELA